MKLFCAKERRKADCIIVPFWEKKEGAVIALPQKEFSSLAAKPIKEKDFLAKPSEMNLSYLEGFSEKRLLLLGLGKEEEVTFEKIRQAYGEAIKYCISKKIKILNVLIPQTKHFHKKEIFSSVVEGITLANYVFDKYKKEKKSLVEEIYFIGCDKQDEQVASDLLKIAESVFMSRDLINDNADVITPQKLAEVALSLEKLSPKIKVKVHTKKQLEEMGMGLLLAVGQGSKVDPALIEIHYHNHPSKEVSAIIGKGLTFDSGGLCLKSGENMLTMREDMSGASAVLGTMRALAILGKKVNVSGFIGCTENAIGPASFKPGDVVKSFSGKTVEIINTDAEGRLVLADVISYAIKKVKPKRIIDLATLTGAIVVALGDEVAGLFTNNDELSKQILDSSQRTGERTWRMPLVDSYKKLIESEIADIKNLGDRRGSSITAALFLEAFTENTPWAHLDIAGSAFRDKPKGYLPHNASGFGVRLLVEYFDSLQKKKK